MIGTPAEAATDSVTANVIDEASGPTIACTPSTSINRRASSVACVGSSAGIADDQDHVVTEHAARRR